MEREELIKAFLGYEMELKGFILALTRNIEISEDVFQEVALAILGETPDASILDFRAWAREIARRRVLEYFRKTARKTRVEAPSGTLAEIVTIAFAENEEPSGNVGLRLQFLRECLGRLSGKASQLVRLRYQERLSARKISEAVGLKPNSVNMTLSRIRKVLAECILRKERLRSGL